jgi:hypothetical protein
VIAYDDEGVAVTDVLIRNVPEEDLARVDRIAERLGVSRSDYLKQVIAGQRDVPGRKVTLADLERFAEVAADLNDPEVMRGAWR